MKRFLTLEYYLGNDRFDLWYLCLGIFSAIIIFAFVGRFIFKRKKNFAPLKSLSDQFYYGYLFFGVLGLLGTFLRRESLPGFSYRAVNYSILILFLAGNVWLVVFYFKRTKKNISNFLEKSRKEKWLKNNARKNKSKKRS